MGLRVGVCCYLDTPKLPNSREMTTVHRSWKDGRDGEKERDGFVEFRTESTNGTRVQKSKLGKEDGAPLPASGLLQHSSAPMELLGCSPERPATKLVLRPQGTCWGGSRASWLGPSSQVLGGPLPFLQEPTGEGRQAFSVCPHQLQRRHSSGPQASSPPRFC